MNKIEIIDIIKYIYSNYEYEYSLLDVKDEYLIKIYCKDADYGVFLKYKSENKPELYEIFYNIIKGVEEEEMKKNMRRLEKIINIPLDNFKEKILKLDL